MRATGFMAWGSALGEYLQPGDVGAALANHSARRILMDLDLGLRVCACARALMPTKRPPLWEKNNSPQFTEENLCVVRACTRAHAKPSAIEMVGLHDPLALRNNRQGAKRQHAA